MDGAIQRGGQIIPAHFQINTGPMAFAVANDTLWRDFEALSAKNIEYAAVWCLGFEWHGYC